MNRMFLVCILALISFSAAAEGARQVMVGKSDLLRGRFTEQKHLEGFKEAMISEGRFTVTPAYGIIWELEKPFATTTVITPAGLVQTINGAEVMKLPSQKIPFMLHLYDALGGALTGNWEPLEADFIVTRNGDAESWQVTLTPRQADNPAMPFSAINVSGHRFVDHVVMLRPDGDSEALTFLDEHISSTSPTDKEKSLFSAVGP